MVMYVFSLESPRLGDSDEYTQWDYFNGTQERVRNSHGKRAISVRATEGLL